MDPNNGLCNQISASGACDFQRMYNFNNYPTANNGYYTGNIFAGGTTCASNTGGLFSGGNGNLYNTDVNYSNGTYSYSNKPSGLAIGLLAFGAVGMAFGAWAQGKAAQEQQEQQREQDLQKFAQWKQLNQEGFELQKQQVAKQARDERLKNLVQLLALSSAIDKAGSSEATT